MRGAIYARYSSENQRDVSIDDQISACMRYAQLTGVTVADKHIYSDAAVSGTLSERNGLTQLMDAARGKEIDVIIIDDLSRLSRNVAHTLLIINELDNIGISLHSVADSLDTSKDGAKINYHLHALINEIAIDDLSKKTLRGQLGQKERGFFLAEKTFGYKNAPDGKVLVDKKGRSRPEGYKMHIVQHEADVIVRIFQMYANGISITGIAKQLNEEQIPFTKRGWTTATIFGILNNEKYIGTWAWGKLQNKRNPVTGKITQVPRPTGPLFVATLPELRIISQDLWDKVRSRRNEVKKAWPSDRLKKRFSSQQRSYVTVFPKELLSGAMFCSVCGSAIGKVSGKGEGYYGCLRARHGACNNKIIVRKVVVEKIIISEITKILSDIDKIKYVLSRVETFGAKLFSTIPKDIDNINAELSEHKKKIDNFVRFISEGNYSKSVAESLSISEQKVEALQVELSFLVATKESAFVAPPIKWIEGSISNLVEILKKQTEQSALLLRNLLGKITLRPEFPDAGKPYLVAESKLQSLVLLDDKRPQKGPLSTKPDPALDTGSNSIKWWRERRPTAKQSQSPRSS